MRGILSLLPLLWLL